VATPFRPLESPQNRKDEIVTAAISAFVGRTRPTRFEANQLEDLVLPILPYTEPATRRLAAACISHTPHAPHGLVMRLCEEETEVCAALLLRSPVLQDADLIGLVDNRGVTFARVIARRPILTQKIRNLLLTLGDPMIATALHADKAALPELHPAIAADPTEISEKLEAARNALRDMMRLKAEPARHNAPERLREASQKTALSAPSSRFTARREPQQLAARLRATALLSDDSFFITTLADLHGLSFERAKSIVQRSMPSELIMALHAAGLTAADSFIIISAYYPAIAKEKHEIALFIARYDAMVHDQTLTNVRRWKAEEISTALRSRPANLELAHRGELKVS
jgi:uncharacterized protein (DUF2336 family)